MPFAPFFKQCPDFAKVEFRNIDILDEKVYPPMTTGNHGCLEMIGSMLKQS